MPALYRDHVAAWERQDDWPRFAWGARTGRVVVCLALRGARDAQAAHRTVVHAPPAGGESAALAEGGRLPERPTVTVLRPDDPALRPDEGTRR